MNRWRTIAARGLNALWYGRHPLGWLLWPVAFLFRGLVALRRMAYRKGWLESVTVGLPVIVIGNITVGGTGKTPLTIWLARRLTERGYRVGIVCRGYRGAAQEWPQLVTATSDVTDVGDEAVLLHRRAGCPVAAGPDRAAAAGMLSRSGGIDVILADDGLQHYRLARDFEIAVIDGTRALGNGWCLPAGPLREPRTRLAETDAVVVNQGAFGHSGVLRAHMQAGAIVDVASGEQRRLADFSGQRVHAVAAIGNPDRFFDLLDDAGIEVEPHPHADHAMPGIEDFNFGDDAPILVTEKDAVKCRQLKLRNVWRVESDLEFVAGDGERLLRMLARQLQQHRGGS